MPAALSHYLLAQRLYNQLEPKEQISLESFLWGAQGPDFLYCHRLFPWQKGENLREYGRLFHLIPADELLEEMRTYDCLAKDTQIHSYLLGFLCHYTLDSVAHPFIQYSAQMLHTLVEPSTVQTCHHTVEAMLDVIFLRYERGVLPTEIGLKETVPKHSQTLEAMGRLYSALFEKLFQKQAAESLIQQCCKDCRTAYGWMTDRTSLKKQWLTRREKRKKIPPVLSCHLRSMTEEDDFDYANSLHMEWQWPMEQGTIKTDSFFDLVGQAEEQFKQLSALYEQGKPLSPLTKDRPFL